MGIADGRERRLDMMAPAAMLLCGPPVSRVIGLTAAACRCRMDEWDTLVLCVHKVKELESRIFTGATITSHAPPNPESRPAPGRVCVLP